MSDLESRTRRRIAAMPGARLQKAPRGRSPIPARLVEDRRYAEQLLELKAQHPDWHIREGQALMWEDYDHA